jgi:protein SCO1/2
MNETARRPFFLFLLMLLGFALAACGSTAAEEPPLAGAKIGGPFTLVNQHGRTITDKEFQGKYRIVYFGFANCPDICPTDLAAISQALKKFEKAKPALGVKVVPIFISVDPERDTPARLKDYAAAFHPRLVALTGSTQQIADAAKAYAVYYGKVPADNGDYTMDHMRVAFLMDPDGKPVAMLPNDLGAEAMAAELQRWVR